MGPQAPSVLTLVSAASLTEGDVAPDSIATAFGECLAASAAAVGSEQLPFNLGGTSVSLTDTAGRVYAATPFFVSPGQINLLVPQAMAFGTTVASVAPDGKVVAEGLVNVGPIAPAFFTANANGKGVPAALALRVGSDGSRTNEPVYDCPTAGSCVPRPIDVRAESGQVYLQLFGTGIRGCSSDARILVGSTALPALSTGPQGQYPGLDQVNVQLLATLAGTGETDVALHLNCGRSSTPVRIHIR
jgi:uncharacterized protein (TIGR03437 family)